MNLPGVIDFPREAPPPGHHEFPPARGLDGLEVFDGGVVAVGAEHVLLAVRAAENDVAERGLNGGGRRV